MSTIAIKTGSLTINAAFLKEIKDDNSDLSNLIDATFDALTSQSAEKINVRALFDIMSQIRDYLAMHFALEDEFGYFDDAVDVPFQLSCQADILKAQHEQFYTEICLIVETAESLLHSRSQSIAMKSKVIDAFKSFYVRFQDHEEAERELVFQSFQCDFGETD
ncbi:MAG: hypothetical protein KDB27_07220 [Planctomycetales bacterium]|nr:hypothetical protein [Planctomycetales bacterium]